MTQVNQARIFFHLHRPCWLACFALVFVISGCASFSSMQRAETLQPGQTEGVAYMGIKQYSNASNSEYRDDKEGRFINGEIMVRHGVAEHMDVGVKAFGSGGEATFKWQALDGDIDIALIPGAGLTYMEGFVNGAALVGFDLSERFDLVLGPKVDWRGALADNRRTLAGTHAGGVASLIFYPGHIVATGFEITTMVDVEDRSRWIMQGGLIFFLLDK